MNEQRQGLPFRADPAWWAYRLAIEPLLAAAKAKVAGMVLELRPGELLDVGCGTAWQALRVARLGGPGAGSPAGRAGIAVTAVDLSGRLFPPAGRRLPANLHLLAADARDLPFPSGRFDLALISLVLHELDDGGRGAVIGEIRRVLRPGGALLIMEFDFDPRRERSATSRVIRLLEQLAGPEHHGNSMRFLEGGGVPALAGREGFRVLRSTPVLNGQASVFECAFG